MDQLLLHNEDMKAQVLLLLVYILQVNVLSPLFCFKLQATQLAGSVSLLNQEKVWLLSPIHLPSEIKGEGGEGGAGMEEKKNRKLGHMNFFCFIKILKASCAQELDNILAAMCLHYLSFMPLAKYQLSLRTLWCVKSHEKVFLSPARMYQVEMT